MPEKISLPSVEMIAEFSVDHICNNLLNAIAKKGVPHGRLTVDGESALISHFSLPENVHSKRLFYAAYHVFLKNYALGGNFPKEEGNPRSSKHFWRLRNGLPDRDEFREEVIEKHYGYISANLKLTVLVGDQ